MKSENITSSGNHIDAHRNGAIDVVRGIAISLVILYHLPGSPVRGGLIGVDLFMVLSGYLVTRSLLTSSLAKPDLLDFWLRRIRRVLPAVTTVVCIVAVIRFTYWSVSRKEDLWDAAASIGMVANWRFISSGSDYFRTADGVSPFQHLWSLGVEEQFYVLWPVVVILARRHLSKIIGLLIPLSFWLMMNEGISNDLSRAYFGTDTRIGTLLIGSYLVIWKFGNQYHKQLNWKWLFQVSLIGFIIFAIFIDATNKLMYRGGFLFVALFAAGIVYLANRLVEEHKILKLFGSSQLYILLKFLGLRSYSLYLTHWPVFVLITPERFGVSETKLLFVELILTFVSSEILYRLVEQHFQKVLTSNLRIIRGIVFVSLATCIALSVMARVASPIPSFLKGGESSATSNQSGKNRTLLVGDSVVQSLIDLSSTSSNSMMGQIDHISVSGCGFLPGLVIGSDESVYEPSKTCQKRVDETIWKALQGRRFEQIIWLNAWDSEDREIEGVKFQQTTNSNSFIDLNYRMILRFQKFAKKVVVVTIPEKAAKSNTYNNPPAQVIRDRYAASRQNLLQAARRADVKVVDLAYFVCRGSSPCNDMDMSGNRFRPIDGVHFSGLGGLEALDWLLSQVGDWSKN